MNNHNIDFFELTKTCHPKGMKFKTPYHPDFTSFWSLYINRHAGVGIVLKRKWCTYIQNTYLQNDRFIYINLYFKGHIKVRIITIYIHANPQDKPQRIKLHDILIRLLKVSQKNNYHVLIMKDFNTNLPAFY